MIKDPELKKEGSDSLINDKDVVAFGHLLESFRSLERVLNADLQRHSGMSHIWFDALIRLAEAEDSAMTMSELSYETSLSSGGITRLVDRLESFGYVKRWPSKVDRRVQMAELTKDGREALEAAARIHAENIRTYFTSKLSTTELKAFIATLQKIRVEQPQSR